MRKLIIASLAFTFISACTVQRAQVAQQAKTSLIGMSKAELLSCAGAPVRSESADNIEVLTYTGGGDSTGFLGGGGTNGGGGGAVSLEHRYCEVSFILTNGRVSRINYAGRTGGLLTKGEQCAFVVENCMPGQ